MELHYTLTIADHSSKDGESHGTGVADRVQKRSWLQIRVSRMSHTDGSRQKHGCVRLAKVHSDSLRTRSTTVAKVCLKNFFIKIPKQVGIWACAAPVRCFYKSPLAVVDMFIFSSTDANSPTSCILQYVWPCPSGYHTRCNVTINSVTPSLIIFIRRQAFQVRQTRRRACCGWAVHGHTSAEQHSLRVCFVQIKCLIHNLAHGCIVVYRVTHTSR